MKKEVELIVGHVYRGKKPRKIGFAEQYYDDRMILHIGAEKIQYDSPSVKDSKHYPTMPKEKFLKWAGRDVTDDTPKGGWNLV